MVRYYLRRDTIMFANLDWVKKACIDCHEKYGGCEIENEIMHLTRVKWNLLPFPDEDTYYLQLYCIDIRIKELQGMLRAKKYSEKKR